MYLNDIMLKRQTLWFWNFPWTFWTGSHLEHKLDYQHWCTLNRFFLLQLTERHRTRWPNAKPNTNPKSRIKRLSECGVEGVEVDQWVRGDSVEGQSSSRTVHIHCYSTRGGGGAQGEVCHSVIVPDGVPTTWAAQTPGLIIHPKSAVSTVSFPSDSSVSHCDMNCSSPRDLPVRATGQTSRTQQLTEAVESLWMIRIWLVFSDCADVLVVIW